MGEAARLLMVENCPVYVLGFGVLCVATQVFFSYERTVRILQVVTLGLFAYVAVILTVNVPWHRAITQSLQPWAFLPKGQFGQGLRRDGGGGAWNHHQPLPVFLAGGAEVEDNDRRPEAKALRTHPEYAAEHLSRIKQDTFIGMTFSNVIAICIVIATGGDFARAGHYQYSNIGASG